MLPLVADVRKLSIRRRDLQPVLLPPRLLLHNIPGHLRRTEIPALPHVARGRVGRSVLERLQGVRVRVVAALTSSGQGHCAILLGSGWLAKVSAGVRTPPWLQIESEPSGWIELPPVSHMRSAGGRARWKSMMAAIRTALGLVLMPTECTQRWWKNTPAQRARFSEAPADW